MATPAPTRAEKPKTTMSREYIVSRIEARVASLRSKVNRDTKDLEAIQAREAKEVRQWLDKMYSRMAAEVTSLGDFLRSKPDNQAVIERLGELRGVGYEVYNHPRFGTREDSDRVREIAHDSNRNEQELELLEHAVAYLRENPMEEFSITALGRLGLMDAVKFALTPEAAARR